IHEPHGDATTSYVVASTSYVDAITSYVVASTNHVDAITSYVVASTSYVVASTSYMVASTWHVVASASHVVASTRRPAASSACDRAPQKLGLGRPPEPDLFANGVGEPLEDRFHVVEPLHDLGVDLAQLEEHLVAVTAQLVVPLVDLRGACDGL